MAPDCANINITRALTRLTLHAIAASFVLGLASGCAAPSPAPVADRSPVFTNATAYIVRPGDTLYSVAWRFELDVDALADRNRLSAPYVIRPGQRLELRQRASTAKPTVTRSNPKPAARPPAQRSSAPGEAVPKPNSVAIAKPTGPIQWREPVPSGLVRDFGAGNKGRDYALEPPQIIRAAADGEVVYVGAGLGGYAHLIILRHAGSWLSAYSVNSSPSVAEGAVVKGGGKLADIVSKASRLNLLHFEIRKEGDPVDPSTVIR